MSAKKAKIFMNGRSQAVRLPKEFRFEADEVYITKRGENIIISAIKPTWDEFFDSKSAFDDDFLKDRLDTPPQERDFD
ncbi:MAG: type II toxin-antitoxin system VapB family antitoxin [Gammaproteobacteria bacterium]